MNCTKCEYKACEVCNRKDDGMTDISEYESGHEMTVEEMREKLKDYCGRRGEGVAACNGCALNDPTVYDCNFEWLKDNVIIDYYKSVFGFAAHAEESAKENTEEINHPDRYKGKYECIEVMRDTFGDTAVKDFCRLNAFKYLWRAEKKNGVEDIRKAVWYLDYLIEMEDGKNDDDKE